MEQDKSLAMAIIEGMKEQMTIMKTQLSNVIVIMYVLLCVNMLLLIGFAISMYDSIKIREDIGTYEETTTTYDMNAEGSNNYVGGDNNGKIENN